MKLFQVYRLLFFLSLAKTSTAIPYYAKIGCNDTCGTMKIPYPFGIGANCSVNTWYAVDCNSSTPYLSALNNLEVLSIDLGKQTVTVNVSMKSDCQNPILNSNQILNMELDMSPFMFSRLHNKFVMEGCGNAVILEHGSVVTGCSATCRNDTVSDVNNCLGINCCQATLPHNLKSYSMNLTGLERQGGDAGCGSAFLVDETSYVEGIFSRQYVVKDNYSYAPISLLWTLLDRDLDQVSCYSAYSHKVKLDLGNGTSVMSQKCNCVRASWEGSPYLKYGCEVTEECQRCESSGRFCLYEEIYDDDGAISEWNFTCNSLAFGDYYRNKSSLGVILETYTPVNHRIRSLDFSPASVAADFSHHRHRFLWSSTLISLAVISISLVVRLSVSGGLQKDFCI